MTSAALRRKWIYDNEQFVRGRIWSLEESAVQSLIELFTDSRGRLQQGLTDVFDRYAPGGQWTAGDAAFRQRTEYLLAQIDNEVAGLMAASQDATLRAATLGYQGGFYGRAWMLEQGLRTHQLINLPLLPSEAIRAAILAPYRGLTFIDRFADARDDFVRRIRRAIVQSQIEGDTIYQAQKRIADALGINIGRRTKLARLANQGLFNRTEMIARTEILRSSNLGAMQIYLENRDTIKGWQWLLTFDERTCEICIGKNAGNKVYTFEQRETPPAHPRCRCTIVPVLHDGALERNIAGERMTYDQWAGSRGLQGADGSVMQRRGRPAPKSRSTAAAQAAPGVYPA